VRKPLENVPLAALSGAILLWLAQPPLAWGLVAWLALVPWGALIARRQDWRRRDGWIVWAAGAVYWLVSLEGIRYAHPALYPCWFALGGYLGVYPLLFVALARVIHHGWKLPLWLAMPIVWSGLELIRSYALTGFSAAMLGHSQVDYPRVVQIADLGGTPLVSFVVAMVNGLVVDVLWSFGGGRAESSSWSGGVRHFPLRGTIITALILGATVGYGWWRIRQADALAKQPPLLTVQLLQRDEPIEYAMTLEEDAAIFQRYAEGAIVAVQEVPETELVIWPESMFTGGLPYRTLSPGFEVPREIGMEAAEFAAAIEQQQAAFLGRCRLLQDHLVAASGRGASPELLVGCAVFRYGKRPQAFGGAIHIRPGAEVAQWYGKRHLVMFGEYLPMGEVFPWLYEIGPLRQGTTPGEQPLVMEAAGVGVMPSICFETVVEQVLGNHLRELRSQPVEVELLTNLTNDAWFAGSAILSHHRRCAQMVALINRRPLIVAANQGPTVWIDGSGRLCDTLAFKTNQALTARPTRDQRWSLYQVAGDKACLPFSALVLAAAIDGYRRKRKGSAAAQLR